MTATSSILGKEDINNVGAGDGGGEKVAQLLEIMWIMHWAYRYICRLFAGKNCVLRRHSMIA
jgi:hypothetical protein